MVVASFGFSESRLLGELYAQAMQDAGIPVRRAPGLASREVVQPALEQGVVDFVAEYSGTALEFSNGGAGQATSDAGTTHAALRTVLADRGLTALEAAPAQDQNAVAVTRATADRFGLSKVSDLVHPRSAARVGRPRRMPGTALLPAGPGGDLRPRVQGVPAPRCRRPPDRGRARRRRDRCGADVHDQPVDRAKGLVLLVDDRGLQPAENVVPIVRSAVLARHGDALRHAVDAVSASLTTYELMKLNRAVEKGEEPAVVAAAWLARYDLTENSRFS